VIQQFHPDENGEPCWRGIFEEFIPVGGDVETPELVGEICLEEIGLKWDGVDDWEGC
jgi:hypothetical protein